GARKARRACDALLPRFPEPASGGYGWSVKLARTAVLAVTVAAARSARAEEPGEPHRLVWGESRPRGTPAGAFDAGTFLPGAAAIELGTSDPTPARWLGRDPFDLALRGALLPDAPGARSRVELASDVLVAIALAYPVTIDGALVPGIDRNADLAEQLLVM